MKAARLAAAAALVGALLGASVPGVFTLTATNRQVEGETVRSRSEFLRLQRQEAYAKFVTDVRNLDVMINTIGSAGANVCGSLVELNRQYDEMENGRALVSLIGSGPARDSGERVSSYYKKTPLSKPCVVDGVDRLMFEVTWSAKGDRNNPFILKFIEAARRDLTT